MWANIYLIHTKSNSVEFRRINIANTLVSLMYLWKIFIPMWLESVNYPHTFWKSITCTCKNLRNEHNMDILHLVHDVVGFWFGCHWHVGTVKNPSRTDVALAQCVISKSLVKNSIRSRVTKMWNLAFSHLNFFINENW